MFPLPQKNWKPQKVNKNFIDICADTIYMYDYSLRAELIHKDATINSEPNIIICSLFIKHVLGIITPMP